MAKNYGTEVNSAIRKAQPMRAIGTTSHSPCRAINSASPSASDATEVSTNLKRNSNLRSNVAVHACAQRTYNTHSEHCNRAGDMDDVPESNRTMDSQPGMRRLESSDIPWPTTDTGSSSTTISIQPYSNGLESRVERLPGQNLCMQEPPVANAHGQAGGGPGISIAMQRYLLEPARDGGPTYALLWGTAW